MTIIRTSDENLLPALSRYSWILLLILTAAGSMLVSARFGLSTLAGGILALGNYFWLRNIMQRILIQQRPDAKSYALLRYILRLSLLAIAVVVLFRIGVDITGLLFGLSVLVITITIFSVYTLMRPKGD